MALTRKFLKAMGIGEETLDQIIEAHTETVNGLKDRLDQAQAGANALPGVQAELDAARAELEAVKNDGWKDKHDKLKKEFEDYKAGVTARETKAAKEAAARAWYERHGITGTALGIAMRGSGAEIEALELADGTIRDDAALTALVKGDFAGLVGTTTTAGANTAHPPAGSGGGTSKEDILNIKDAGARQKAMAKHHALFGF